ncbi:hypothetical protein VI817_009415 [Penicillium citrinum]|nr:hypothetical protein VI817_009415 [Penicillium citrinum]
MPLQVSRVIVSASHGHYCLHPATTHHLQFSGGENATLEKFILVLSPSDHLDDPELAPCSVHGGIGAAKATPITVLQNLSRKHDIAEARVPIPEKRTQCIAFRIVGVPHAGENLIDFIIPQGVWRQLVCLILIRPYADNQKSTN